MSLFLNKLCTLLDKEYYLYVLHPLQYLVLCQVLDMSCSVVSVFTQMLWELDYIQYHQKMAKY